MTYTFMVSRSDGSSEWLKARIAADEIQEEAEMLLTDPRDTITNVHVWSDKGEQFTRSYRRALDTGPGIE